MKLSELLKVVYEEEYITLEESDTENYDDYVHHKYLFKTLNRCFMTENKEIYEKYKDWKVVQICLGENEITITIYKGDDTNEN